MTDLQIVNRALDRIGAQAATSMADTRLNQAKAATAYPMARDEVLRMFTWPSVVTRAALLNVDDLRCQWILSHVYHVDDYSTNDTGKVYRCITAGTSAGAGGPTGTAADITDGTVHWKYIGANDLTINWAWRPSTAYVVNDVVANQDGMIFYCITLGTSAASGGPTAVNADITDGTAHWCYYATTHGNLTSYFCHYLYPTDALRITKIPLNVLDENSKGAMYKREGRFIYTDTEYAVARYVEKCADSLGPSKWDELLQAVVVLRLAQNIAMSVTGKQEILNSVTAEMGLILPIAKGAAASEGSEGVEEPARWEDA